MVRSIRGFWFLQNNQLHNPSPRAIICFASIWGYTPGNYLIRMYYDEWIKSRRMIILKSIYIFKECLHIFTVNLYILGISLYFYNKNDKNLLFQYHFRIMRPTFAYLAYTKPNLVINYELKISWIFEMSSWKSPGISCSKKCRHPV